MEAFSSISIHGNAGEHNELVAAVLSIIVEASSALDCQSLCSLLQLNTVCRKAVLGSRGHHSISIKAVHRNVAGFAAWLPRHAGLIGGLKLVIPAECVEYEELCNFRVDWEHRAEKSKKPLETALASALQQSCAAGHAAPPFSTSAAHPDTADAPTMPLLLTSFGSQVYVSPAVLHGLPSATLTRLELDEFCRGGHSCHDTKKAGVLAVLQHLTNLDNLKIRTDQSRSYWGGQCQCIRELPHLPPPPPLLTRLDIGPLDSLKLSILPPSLVELKLIVDVGDPRQWPSDDEGDEWVEPVLEVDHERLQAARRLDLTHLPLLQSCKVRRMLSDYEAEGRRRDDTQTMTVTLASPNLTSLELYGNLSDVLGLPVPCAVQELSLVGCSIRGSRLAQLVSHMPNLVDFFYDGYDRTFDEPWLNFDCPLVEVPMIEEWLVAAALGGATKLTSLYLDGFGLEGRMMWGEDGLVEVHRCVDRVDQEPEQELGRVRWGHHISGLVNLRKLILFVDVDDSDVLQFTALSALTDLYVSGHGFKVDEETFDAVVPHLPALQLLNRPLSLDYTW